MNAAPTELLSAQELDERSLTMADHGVAIIEGLVEITNIMDDPRYQATIEALTRDPNSGSQRKINALVAGLSGLEGEAAQGAVNQIQAEVVAWNSACGNGLNFANNMHEIVTKAAPLAHSCMAQTLALQHQADSSAGALVVHRVIVQEKVAAAGAQDGLRLRMDELQNALDESTSVTDDLQAQLAAQQARRAELVADISSLREDLGAAQSKNTRTRTVLGTLFDNL